MKVLYLIDAVNNWVGRIVSLLIVPMVVVGLYEMVLRYGLDSPTLWAFETNAFLFCGYILLGGAYTLLYRAHVNMDIVYTRFSLRGKAILDLITAPLFFLFCGVLLKEGWEFFWEALSIKRTSGSHWNPPVYPVMAVLPLGAFLMLLQGLAKFFRDLIKAIYGRELA